MDFQKEHVQESYEVCKSRHRKFRMRNTLSQERLQITVVLANERNISVIKFQEYFAMSVIFVTPFKKGFVIVRL